MGSRYTAQKKNASAGSKLGESRRLAVAALVMLTIGVVTVYFQTRQVPPPQEPAPAFLDDPSGDYRSRSCPDCPEFLVDIRNLRSQVVEVFWVDFEGREVPYGSIAPGDVFSQPTSSTDVWVVRQGDVFLQRIAYPEERTTVEVK